MGSIQGSKDPNNRVLRPKYHEIYHIWFIKALLVGSLDPYGYLSLV